MPICKVGFFPEGPEQWLDDLPNLRFTGLNTKSQLLLPSQPDSSLQRFDAVNWETRKALGFLQVYPRSLFLDLTQPGVTQVMAS